MTKEKEILEKNRRDYNLIADHFSSTRKYPWRDFEFLFDEISKGDKVLDLGCGNGRFYEFLEGKEVDYVGIDKAEKLIEKAKERYPEVDFRVGDALDLPFEDNSFDYVFSIAVFHHIPSEDTRLKFLSEAKRVLKKEGKIKISVWDLLRTDKQIYFSDLGKKVTGRLGFRDAFLSWKNDKGEVITKRYYHAFKKNELQKLAEKVEFENIEVFQKGQGIKSSLFLFTTK